MIDSGESAITKASGMISVSSRDALDSMRET